MTELFFSLVNKEKDNGRNFPRYTSVDRVLDGKEKTLPEHP